MEKADIERERILLMPVRELLTIESVREQRLAGNERIFLVRGHLHEILMASRSLRTPDPWKASLCEAAIGRSAVWVKWRRNLFNKFAWNEHDILSVESQS